MPNHFNFAAKGAIYCVTIATAISSRLKMTCSRLKIACFRVKAHLVFYCCLYNNLLFSEDLFENVPQNSTPMTFFANIRVILASDWFLPASSQGVSSNY